MKRIILVSLAFLIFTSFVSLNAQWARRFYIRATNNSAYSIQQTNDGGYIVVGDTNGMIIGYSSNICILKLTTHGEIEWQRRLGERSQESMAYSVQQTTDGGYIVAGSFMRDILVLKLSASGDIEWQRSYGGSYAYHAYSIQQTNDGGYIFAGSSIDYILVLKLSSNGDIEWQKSYGNNINNRAYSIQQTTDGGYIVSGSSYEVVSGQEEIWVLKLFSNGDIEWQRTYGGDQADRSYSIQQTIDGGYIIAGYTSSFGAGQEDIWVLKLFSNGDIEWQRTYGGIKSDEARSIKQTDDGGYIIAGEYIPRLLDPYAWVLKLSSNGDIEWQKRYGYGSGGNGAESIQQTADGGFIFAGWTRIEFDDIWLLVSKISSNGDIDPSCGNFLQESNAISTFTSITPVETNITPQNTNITPLDTNISAQDINATVTLICEAQEYTLTITATTGGTTDPTPGTYTYDGGTAVNITATPNSGYEFSGWSGDASGTSNPITITMDSDKSIEANFSPTQCWLYIEAGSGGTTNPAPGSHSYDYGTQASVTAVPSSGYQFSGWKGDASGTSNPITITMDSDKSITANFSTITEETGKKGGCFIATAAYGSPLHPYVKILRDFRDIYLMPSKLGRTLVYFYYKYSPFVANLIKKHKLLKVVTRINLLPLVVFGYSMVHLGLIITVVIPVFIFAFPIFLISFFRRRLNPVEAKNH